MSVVLDATAVVALLNREDGWERVRDLLPGAVLSTINLGEVYRTNPEALAMTRLVSRLSGLGVTLKPLSAQDAWLQARVPNLVQYERDGESKRRRLGWGDRTVVALGLRLDRPVLTSDLGLIALGSPYRFETFR